ncbi:hypothetical protein [Bifidobacterium bombi]|uniref:hypothetical protein n=1 Tax=Bifidobacterium bombi TaxID=471511 RepID=UPI000AC6DE28|nr:hypothetical protein [Bifidobacterium bombi]
MRELRSSECAEKVSALEGKVCHSQGLKVLRDQKTAFGMVKSTLLAGGMATVKTNQISKGSRIYNPDSLILRLREHGMMT